MDFEAMMKQMRQKYLADMKSKASELQAMVDKKDIENLESFFHKIKGSGASYGLPAFTEFGAKYEAKAKERDLSDEDFKNIVDEFAALSGAR